MTKNDAVTRLAEVKKQMKELESKGYYGLASFKNFSLIYEEALLEKCIQSGIDPDSVWFHYEVDDGKGIKWKGDK